MADAEEFFRVEPAVGNLSGNERSHDGAHCANGKHIADFRGRETAVAGQERPE